MRRAEWAGTLLHAVEDRTITHRSRAGALGATKQNPNPFIARRAERLSERGGNVATGREEVVSPLPLAKEIGNAARGKEVSPNCAVCHVQRRCKNVAPS
jgi:hypothetical protein